MPKVEPPKHSRFKPGQSGNPNGRPRIPDGLRDALALNKNILSRLINKYAQMTPAELKEVIKAGTAPSLEIIIASNLLKSATSGDGTGIGWMFDRSIGKVKDQLEVSAPRPYIIERSDGSQTVLGVTIDED